MAKKIGMLKRASRYVKKEAKKRYINRGGRIATGKIMKDVAWLKSVLNPEKKRFQQNITDATVGQCNVNANGFYALDITPTPSQGVTSTTRNGNSIKIHSTYVKYQFQSQNLSSGSPIKFRMMVVQVVGQPYTSVTSAVTTMFDANSFITGGSITDYNSDRNEEAFKQFKIIRSQNLYLKPNGHSNQRMHFTGGMGIKWKSHHVKYVTDAGTSVQDGQYFLLILADNGNVNATTGSTLVGTSEFSALTGAALQLDITQWYYDN